jgi:hypothetical protein
MSTDMKSHLQQQYYLLIYDKNSVIRLISRRVHSRASSCYTCRDQALHQSIRFGRMLCTYWFGKLLKYKMLYPDPMLKSYCHNFTATRQIEQQQKSSNYYSLMKSTYAMTQFYFYSNTIKIDDFGRT